MGNLRHEYKYQISLRTADQLQLTLPSLLSTDSHAGSSGQYLIRSLYFDDPAGTAYLDKLSGISQRTKYRIRFYNLDPSYLVLEAKRKQNQISKKDSEILSLAEVECLCRGKTIPADRLSVPLLGEFSALQRTRGLAPAVIVDYCRTPFVHPLGNTRITIDRDIRSLPYREEDLFQDRKGFPVLDPGIAILEVKFDEILPGFLQSYLSTVPKILCANSKYCSCYAAIH
ncbi:MAG: polyphosphate polymerase domain-containing protein [Clostridia bacterium]|nr:polyphosphate polymerase domain-containing protein [Clostridia bacterium]